MGGECQRVGFALTLKRRSLRVTSERLARLFPVGLPESPQIGETPHG